MRRTLAAALTTALAVVLAGIGLSAPAGAAVQFSYSSTSGGSQVNLLGSTVVSGLTGASNIGGQVVPAAGGNKVASASVPGLVSLGVISTGQNATAYGDGIQVTSTAKIAGISLLGGVIKADALEVTNTGRVTSGGFTHTGDSKLVNLKLGSTTIPLSAAPNTTITIPGIAEVVINEQKASIGPAAMQLRASALRVTLLKDIAGGKIGSTILIDPSTVTLVNGSPSNALPVGGFAYGTAATVVAGSAAANVPPTAMLMVPSSGTGGQEFTNATAAANAAPIVTLGALESKIKAITVPGSADVQTQSETARISLLGGIITADAIKVKSHVSKTPDTHLEEQSMEFVNLKVAGKVIPINVKPNTGINVLGLGAVYINQQLSKPGYSMIVGIRVILSVQKLGLPIGTDIQLGVASSYVVG